MKNKIIGKKTILWQTKIDVVIRYTTIYDNFLINSFIRSFEISEIPVVNQDNFEYIAKLNSRPGYLQFKITKEDFKNFFAFYPH